MPAQVNKRLGDLRRLRALLLKHPHVLTILLMLNLGGTVWGFIWYQEQLAATPWYFWPFTPECPIQSLLFAIVIALRLINKPWPFLEAFTFLGLMKYGFWTMGILTHLWITGESPSPEGIALYMGHFGMFLEGLLFLPLLSPARYMILLVGPWFILMDILDYTIGIHPYLPGANQIGAAIALAVTATIGVTLYTLTWLRSTPPPQPRRNLRPSRRA